MTQDLKNLRITRLVEEDFMRIRSIDIRPGGECLVLIKGDNEQGKTSALTAIRSVLEGKRADPDTPIRTGAENAAVQLTLSDDIAERLSAVVSWTPKGRYLTLRQIDGETRTKVSAAQSTLEQLVGALAYDPLKFMRQDPAEQLSMLMGAIGKTTAYAEIQARRKSFYDKRTSLNRKIKEWKAHQAANPDPSPDEELRPKSPDDVQAELAEAQKQNDKIDQYGRKLEGYKEETRRLHKKHLDNMNEVDRLQNLIDGIRADDTKLQEEIGQRHKNAAAYQEQLDGLERVPTENMVETIQQANKHNSLVEEQEKARGLKTMIATEEKTVADHTVAITNLDKEVRQLLNSSDIGKRVEGLAVNEEGLITHNDLPISQASGMRQLELSCLIGMAANPAIRVMCIDEGDRLDPKSLEALKQIATDNNYQIWMTAVYSGSGSDDEHIVKLIDGACADAPPVADDQADINGMYES